jgi:thiamine kinase-like enzyme
LERVYAALARVPLFRNVRQEDIKFELLSGALTNVSYKVTVGRAAYVLRLAGEGTSDYIDRVAEKHNARVAAAAGINVEVIYFDTENGTMVTRFVEGISMKGGQDFSREMRAPIRAALLLKRVHRLRKVFESHFDVFDEIEDYVELLRGWLPALPQEYYEVRQKARAVRLALEASPVTLVPCHNDPWPGNLLDAGARIYLIDWEYSGMNDPLWDLGDLSVEAGFGPEQDRLMLEAYCDGAASPALYSRLELYKAMSDLHWSLWGFVQHTKDNPAEDFWSYSLGRLERCTARMSSATFDQHLDVVRADCSPTLSLRPPPPPGAPRPTGAPTKGSIR